MAAAAAPAAAEDTAPVPAPAPKRRILPWISLAIVWVVWGSTYLAIRVLVREAPPLTAASARFMIAGLLMGGIALVVDRRHGWPSRHQWFDYSLVGVLLLAVGNGLVMWSERTVPSGTAALIVATVPVWILVLDGLRPHGNPWTLRVWLGTVIGLGGVALVARPEAGVSSGHWLAMLGLQVACLAWTLGSLYAQSVPQKLPLASAAAIEMVAGSIALFLLSRLFSEEASGLSSMSSRGWGAFVYLIIFGSLVGFTAFAYCLNELPATTVGTYAYVNPVVAVFLGWLILGESLTPGLLVGGALIVLSVVLTTLRKR
jgi:drug/metabolite transporter (DMT)-like permease